MTKSKETVKWSSRKSEQDEQYHIGKWQVRSSETCSYLKILRQIDQAWLWPTTADLTLGSPKPALLTSGSQNQQVSPPQYLTRERNIWRARERTKDAQGIPGDAEREREREWVRDRQTNFRATEKWCWRRISWMRSFISTAHSWLCNRLAEAEIQTKLVHLVIRTFDQNNMVICFEYSDGIQEMLSKYYATFSAFMVPEVSVLLSMGGCK